MFIYLFRLIIIYQALLVCPSKASTYASLGYVHSLTGNAAEAVEYFQKALALKRDDTFSTTMLNFVLESFLNEAPPFGGLNQVFYLKKKNNIVWFSQMSVFGFQAHPMMSHRPRLRSPPL